MKLDDERESDNFEDRRGGGGMGRAGGIGIGTVVIALVASYFLGIDPSTLLGVAEQVQGPQTQSPGKPIDPANDPEAALKSEVRKVLAKTEDAWGQIFAQGGAQYRRPKLVAFSGRTSTACGAGEAAMGPFYCPGDEIVYLDMAFFREMEQRFRAGGDFARAYVIAHEIGHHVQNQMGTMEKVQRLQQRSDEATSNALSVRLELQADCYAGVWGYNMEKANRLEKGDIEEAIRAAAAVGDDMIQKRMQGYVVPESFTHGSAKERATWFARGFQSGDMRQCNTFGR